MTSQPPLSPPSPSPSSSPWLLPSSLSPLPGSSPFPFFFCLHSYFLLSFLYSISLVIPLSPISSFFSHSSVFPPLPLPFRNLWLFPYSPSQGHSSLPLSQQLGHSPLITQPPLPSYHPLPSPLPSYAPIPLPFPFANGLRLSIACGYVPGSSVLRVSHISLFISVRSSSNFVSMLFFARVTASYAPPPFRPYLLAYSPYPSCG